MIASAMCRAYPTFYWDYNEKSLFISVSENFYEEFIVTQDYTVYLTIYHSAQWKIANFTWS